MTSISKKATSAKKNGNGTSKAGGRAAKSAAKRTAIVPPAGRRYSRRSESTGRFVDKANDHMERAWGKIYDSHGKSKKAE